MSALGDVSDADPSGALEPRMVARMQGDFIIAPWAGSNTSGIVPIGKNVLVRMDCYVPTLIKNPFGADIVALDTQVERMNLGAESGTIYAIGDQAFRHNNDGTLNNGMKPVEGDRVYCEKYAGKEIMGDDGHKYRLMDNSCIGGLYRGAHALIRQPEGSET